MAERAFARYVANAPTENGHVGQRNTMYNDEYPTCEATYATLRVYPGEIDPESVTQRLGVAPSSFQRRGDITSKSSRARPVPMHGWFLESETMVHSKDCRRHIDWILDQLATKTDAVLALQQAGCKMDISCYWLSRNGHGGPTVSPAQMKRLAEMNLDLGFDIYGPYDDEEAQPSAAPLPPAPAGPSEGAH
jgi:hypothetical protein